MTWLSRHGQRLGVAEGDLVLAEVALALGALRAGRRRPSRCGSGAAAARPGRLEQRVVHVVQVGGGEVAVAAPPGVLVGVAVDAELQLGAGVGGQPVLGQPVELAAQDLPGRGDHRVSRRARPGRPAASRCPAARAPGAAWSGRAPSRSRRSRGPSSTSRTRRRCSCRRRRRAGSCSPRCRAAAPRRGSAGVEPLALQPALHVDNGQDHGVDLTGVDQLPSAVGLGPSVMLALPVVGSGLPAWYEA